MVTHLSKCLFVPFNRKFADIEAANHRLASALYLKDKDAPRLSPEDRDAEAVASAASEAPVNPRDGDSSGEQQPGLENLWKGQPRPQTSQAEQRRENKSHEAAETPSTSSGTARQGHPPHRPPDTASDASDAQIAPPDSGYTWLTQTVDTSPAGSPGPGPLSPEACDLSVWMFSDASAGSPESQWSEIVDLLGAGSPDRAYAEVEAYLESICACRGDGQDVESTEFGLADFLDSLTENPGEIVFDGGRSHGDACEYMREDDWEVTQRQNQDSLSTAQLAVERQQPLPASPDHRNHGPELQACRHPRGEGACTLGSKAHSALFEGVAQSFTVPLHHSRPRAIPALPREEDWPFTDILEDRVSMSQVQAT